MNESYLELAVGTVCSIAQFGILGKTPLKHAQSHTARVSIKPQPLKPALIGVEDSQIVNGVKRRCVVQPKRFLVALQRAQVQGLGLVKPS